MKIEVNLPEDIFVSMARMKPGQRKAFERLVGQQIIAKAAETAANAIASVPQADGDATPPRQLDASDGSNVAPAGSIPAGGIVE